MVSEQSTKPRTLEEMASSYLTRCVIDAEKLMEMLGLNKPAPAARPSGGGAAVARVVRTNAPTNRRIVNV